MNRARQKSIAPVLLAIYAALWFALAIAPKYREDWLLENLLVAIALPWLVHAYRRQPFSDLAYACLFVFLVLHAIGAHYTYSEVPYDDWWRTITGTSIDERLGWRRNHFDRLAHAAYGLLIAPAAVELIGCAAAPRDIWQWLLPWSFLCAHSVLYELI